MACHRSKRVLAGSVRGLELATMCTVDRKATNKESASTDTHSPSPANHQMLRSIASTDACSQAGNGGAYIIIDLILQIMIVIVVAIDEIQLAIGDSYRIDSGVHVLQTH
jgi:hypothetical protein